MKILIKKACLIQAFCLIFISVQYSCTDDFLDTNTNPYEVTESPGAKAAITTMQQNVIPTKKGAGAYQLQQNLVGDLYAGYMTAIQTFDGGAANNGQYKFKDAWLDHPLKEVFSPFVSAWTTCKRKSEENNTPEIFAVGEVLKVASLHRFCDMWGSIPYSQLAAGLEVEYDSQEEAYKLMIQDLDSAISVLTNYVTVSPGSQPLVDYDLIYLSDMSKWIKFANSLKLRLALRMAYVEPGLAKQLAEEAVEHPGGLITQNADNAIVHSAYGVTINHPLYTLWNTYGDTRMSGNAQSILTGYNDPRLPVLFQETTINGNTGYYGVREGSNGNKATFSPLSSPNYYPETPLVIMAASEIAFLKAEGALRGWNMGGTSETFYEQGVSLSFEQHKVSGIGTYLSDATSKPATFTTPLWAAGYYPPRSTITIAWNNAVGFEQKLERIITQKWIALFPDGQEAWSEFRRTGYPKLVSPINTDNASSGVPSGETIKRYPFPAIIKTTNPTGYEQAVSKLGGPDNGGTKLWWDKK